MKKVLVLVLALIILTTLPVCAFADDIMMQSTAISETPISSGSISIGNVEESDMFISLEEAEYIAMRFVADTISAGLSSWDEDTEVTSTATMYDQTAESNITAYCVELNSGYVVISAYIGVENIVLEWSDVALPIYENLDISDGDKIVYVGAFGYYKDSGTNILETLSGTSVEKNQISNRLESARDIRNVPEYVLSSITQTNISVCSGSVITDPYAHANATYAGPFNYYEHINKWDSSSSPLTLINMSRFNCKNHCGPTAITNMLKMYGDRFNISSIKGDTVDELFGSVLWIGNAKYYFNADISIGDDLVLGGTVNAWAGAYIKECFKEYGLTATCTKKTISYSNIKTSLSNDHLLYLMATGHPTYGNHAMACYAYTRLVSSTTGLYKTYLKVADGWSTRPRYVDLATMTSDEYWDATISR